MLSPQQINEIKEHLEKAQNPVFFFDNDADGLCSFLLLQRYIGRGKGVAIKSFPELDTSYFRKVLELKADYIFILDKPTVSENFLKEVEKYNIPVVWVDHHDVKIEIPDFVSYFNPLFNKPSSNEPVTVLCYQISKRKEDLWIAVVGAISDKFIPEYYKEFKEEFPDLAADSKDAFKIFFDSQIGKIARLLCFGLKDSVTNVVKMQKFLMKVKSPYDVLEETSQNYSMYYRFSQINKKYTKLLEKASEGVSSSKILFFQYGGDLSISSDLSNELSYLFPDKIIVVIYITGIKANISIRGENAKKIILQAIEGLENARGGGHEDAVGGQVKIEDLEKFRENIKNIVELGK